MIHIFAFAQIDYNPTHLYLLSITVATFNVLGCYTGLMVSVQVLWNIPIHIEVIEHANALVIRTFFSFNECFLNFFHLNVLSLCVTFLSAHSFNMILHVTPILWPYWLIMLLSWKQRPVREDVQTCPFMQAVS